MGAELANLNHCAVHFLLRAAVNLILYNTTSLLLLQDTQYLPFV